jgi:fructose-1,6-bisphosphatase/inositol monophosphatase family enzyme
MKSISDPRRPGRVIRSIKSMVDGGMQDLTREADYARKAALAAGEILKRYYGTKYEIGSKGRDNPVTIADTEADTAIKSILTSAFPDYGWLSEETVDNSDRLDKRRVWIVDPLDGTKEFINNVPEFCVAIGLVDNGEPVVGVSYNPITDEMFWSARGMGCHLGKARVRVTKTRILRRSSVLASRSETARGEWEVFDALQRSRESQRNRTRRMGSVRRSSEGRADRQCRLQAGDGGGRESGCHVHSLAEK